MKINKEKVELQMARMQTNKMELAKKAEMSPTTLLSALGRGMCNPVTIGKIAAALEVDPSEIIG